MIREFRFQSRHLALVFASAALAITLPSRIARAADPATAPAKAAPHAAAPAVVMPKADLKWQDNPAVKGARVAVLWGDPKVGAYGALKSIPAGAKLAAHTHTQDQRVVLVSGELLLAMAGGTPTALAVGSYAFVPGGAVHTAECKPGAECIYFEEQQGPADIKYVDPAQGK